MISDKEWTLIKQADHLHSDKYKQFAWSVIIYKLAQKKFFFELGLENKYGLLKLSIFVTHTPPR